MSTHPWPPPSSKQYNAPIPALPDCKTCGHPEADHPSRGGCNSCWCTTGYTTDDPFVLAQIAEFEKLMRFFHEALCTTEHPPGVAGFPCQQAFLAYHKWSLDKEEIGPS